MTDNNLITTADNTSKDNKPSKSEPKYRKRLNRPQLITLHILYRFRFASNEHIATYFEKKSSKFVQKRLKILEDQGFIAKRYDKSYKLKGKPAAYYLLPKGARALQTELPLKDDEPVNLKRIYKDKEVSESFIQHCLNIFDIYLALKALYSDKFSYFTKSQLNYKKYDYFPTPLPDVYIKLKTSRGNKHFFLDIFEDAQPFFVQIRRIKRYLDYAGGGDWGERGGGLPTILLVVESKSIHKRLRKRLAYELRESYEEISFATTRLEHILKPEYKGCVWFPIDEDGDDPDEPLEAVGLSSL